MIWALILGCTTPFSNTESEGTWVQSDFQFDLNRDCDMNIVLTDALQLSYQFGDGEAVNDSGYWGYSLDPDMIGSYKNNLWDYCSRSSSDSAAFTCPMPLFLAHYSTWKDNFFLEQVSAERGCQVSFYSASEEGLFIDQRTVRLGSSFYASCEIESGDGYQELGLCAGTVSSKLTKISTP